MIVVGSEHYEGVSLNGPLISEFFSPALRVTIVDELQEVNVSQFSLTLQGWDWFIPDSANRSSPDSWYARIRRVLIALLKPVLNCLCQDAGRQKRKLLADNFFDNYLLKEWTGGNSNTVKSASGTRLPEQLVILDFGTLEKWREYLSQYQLAQSISTAFGPAPNIDMIEEDQRTSDEWLIETPQENIDKAVQRQDAFTETLEHIVTEETSPVLLFS